MNTLRKVSLPALVLSVASLPSVVAAQTATPMDTLQTDGTALIVKIGVMVGALAIAMLAVKAVPAAFNYVAGFIRK